MEKAITYNGRDNSFTLTFEKNGTTLTETEMNTITKFEIKFNGSYYNSTDNASGFDVTAASGAVEIFPNELDLAVSSGDVVEVIVYDDSHDDGLVWDRIILEIKNDAIPEA